MQQREEMVHRNSFMDPNSGRCDDKPAHLEIYVVEGGDKGISDVEMESATWSQLPEEVIEQVLLLLPSSAQARFRAVCRAWLWLLSSPGFMHRSACLALTLPSVVCAFQFRPRSKVAPDRDEIQVWRARYHKTVNLDLSFLPPLFANWNPVTKLQVVHSSGGLICLQCTTRNSDTLRFCVLNPMNLTYRELPELVVARTGWRYSDCIAGRPGMKVVLVVDKKKGGLGSTTCSSFKVIVIRVVSSRSVDDVGKFCVYSSISDEWKVLYGRGEHSVDFSTVVYNYFSGCNHLVLCNESLFVSMGCKLRKLSTETGGCVGGAIAMPQFEHYWVEMPGQWWGSHSGDFEVYLAEHDGTLMACSGAVWTLDFSRLQWEQTVDAPEELLAKMESLTGTSRKFFGLDNVQVAGDLLLMTLRESACCQIFAYHLRHRCWSKLSNLHDGFQFMELRSGVRLQ